MVVASNTEDQIEKRTDNEECAEELGDRPMTEIEEEKIETEDKKTICENVKEEECKIGREEKA